MNKFLLKSKSYIFKHKVISLIAVLVIVFAGYKLVKAFISTPTQTLYTLGAVTRGTILSTVSGTGQVSALDQVDLKTKASGDVVYLNNKVGKEVSAGTLIAELDANEASYELESAKLSYDKLVTIDPDVLHKDQNALTDAQKNLETAYSDGLTATAKASTDLSDNLSGVKALLDGYLSSTQSSQSNTERQLVSKTGQSYYTAYQLLYSFLKSYRGVPVDPDREMIESLISQSRQVAASVLESAKSVNDTMVYIKSHEDKTTTDTNTAYTSANSLLISADTIVSDLLSAENNITKSKRSLDDATVTLSDLKAGPDTLDLRSQELSIKQKQDAVNDYSVTAPFAGMIASAGDINLGDTVSSGTTVVTLITKQKIAEISLNEIDAAKVKVGQKVSLTFDAIDDLNITGTVAEINLIGTVSQGVVSYTIKIAFDTQDDRVKSGMSVSASIITEAKTDVLILPASAVKNQGNTSYVEIFDNLPAGALNGQPTTSATLPRQQEVTVGITNDTDTEILSGLKEGDLVVTKTTTSGAVATAAKTPSISSLLSGNRTGTTGNRAGGGGGFVRPAGN